MGAAQLRGVLLRAQQRMDAEHRVATSTWRAPLSLFDERQASNGGIPDWAIRTVLKARRLVEQAAGLGDLTDVYEAQILTAQREKRGIARAPLLRHLENLDSATEQLRAHHPYLEAAKNAFNSPVEAETTESLPGLPSSAAQSPHPDKDEAPVVILQPVPRRSAFFSSLGRRPKEYLIKFLEGAVDVIGAAGSATGMSVDLEAEPQQQVAKPISSEALEKLDSAFGTISPWLNAQVGADLAPGRVHDEVDWTCAQVVWEHCRRKSDRRWTLA
ncbi:unnamed protein product [Symbiodinium microadriaticum]|nr:unnamed protein product [Symbiodinium microadriaticum]